MMSNIANLRNKALAKSKELAWPDSAREVWRKTRVSELGLDTLAVGEAAYKPAQEKAQDLDWYGLDLDEEPVASARINGFDGQYTLASDSLNIPGLEVYSLVSGRSFLGTSTIPSALQARAESALDKLLQDAEHKLTPWTLAHGREIIVVEQKAVKNKAPSSSTNKTPSLVLSHGYRSAEAGHFPLVLVFIEGGAQLALVQRVWGGAEGFLSLLVHAEIGDNARLEESLVQDLDTSSVAVLETRYKLGRYSFLRANGVHLGSGMAMCRAQADLADEGAEAHLDGFYLARDEQHLEIQTVQNHLVPHGTSRALYKGVVGGAAHSIYRGMITVAPAASKTDAYLTNNNMLLNDGARAESIPCLAILTNDVKCSHGSTTGTLPADQVFYLKTRGFSAIEARRSLVAAYLGEVADRMDAGLRFYLGERIASSLAD